MPGTVAKSNFPSSTDLSSPRRVIAGYRLYEEIGRGGISRVYRAKCPKGKEVAFKINLRESEEQTIDVDRLFEHLHSVQKIKHPNLVTILDYGIEGQVLYTVMDLLRGQTLASVLKRKGPLPEDVACGYIRQVCAALRVIHQAGVLHGDIKPENIMLTDSGQAVLIDHCHLPIESRSDDDLSHKERTQATPIFMPPESFSRSGKQDCRSDIYSLAQTLYVLLAGTSPFKQANVFDLVNAKKTESYKSLRELEVRVSLGTNVAINRSLSADLDRRPASIDEFVRLLSFDESLPVDSERTGAVEDAGPIRLRGKEKREFAQRLLEHSVEEEFLGLYWLDHWAKQTMIGLSLLLLVTVASAYVISAVLTSSAQ